MKKLYSTLALAFTVVASASAVEPTAQQEVKKAFNGLQTEFVKSNRSTPEKVQKAPEKISSALDIEGYYAMEYEYPFSGAYTNGNVIIEAVDDAQVLLQFEPWCSGYTNIVMDPIIADLDLAASTLTITTADNLGIGTYRDSSGVSYSINVATGDLTFDSEGKGQLATKASISATINADGSIAFTPGQFLGLQCVLPSTGKSAGYIGGFIDLKLVAPDMFAFDAADWTSLGNATWTENVVNQIFSSGYHVDPTQVEVFQNKAKSTLYALKNPYLSGEWGAEVNEDPSATGYLVFDVEDPACVWLRPLTDSGLYLTMEEGGFPEAIYFYNVEGDRVFNEGMSTAETKIALNDVGYTCSTYDEATNTVNLLNIFFGYGDNPGGFLMWTAAEDPSYTIVLPELGAVNNLATDASGVATRYYNLQGVEIANPEAGQLVIVKEANKTYKTIVR